jgi:uncharacterized protein YeeX (DUF496 family)
MADETKQVEETGEVAETTEAQETTTPLTIEELSSQVAELSKLDETRKNEIAGLNRANTEAATKYQDLLKSTETDKQTTERLVEEQKTAYEKEQNDFLNSKAEFSKKENNFNVRVKALELGFTAEDIEMLDFNSIESVEKYKTFLDSKLQTSNEDQTKKIETALSGSRDNLNGSTKVDNMPRAFNKAFE